MAQEGFLVAGIWILLGTALMAMYRVIAGPTLPDRVVGLNTITTKIVGILTILAILWREYYLIDMAIVLLMVNSIGGLILAKHMERRGND
ncbi:monovalent cation/H+ antiporter complex subunit F [Pyrococcus abyssi]|uniref:Multiple resistance and pH regulation protein F (MrpF / PhaF) n=1 Tax=Pyrococcus abyssi (strain GE5 / Orsay) TaxID=272844 RepID=Q9UZE5_PYRAB|nr:monovalent cation/H+ antiporter complex subunit F [Pyrococcus abyssi]CAB50114.1 Multiple resistance and pH regulation protein F (mrpF / PhaF) [Pyrococcus abyssi GE5]CCE70638.1 TPA: putative monovalent cation/H+ antiporter subunit F [Pyrococcus abyssi GE5]